MTTNNEDNDKIIGVQETNETEYFTTPVVNEKGDETCNPTRSINKKDTSRMINIVIKAIYFVINKKILNPIPDSDKNSPNSKHIRTVLH